MNFDMNEYQNLWTNGRSTSTYMIPNIGTTSQNLDRTFVKNFNLFGDDKKS